MTRKTLLAPLAGLCLLLGSAPLPALDTTRADVRAFVANLSARHGFDAVYLENVLAESRTQQKIIDALDRPAEKTKPWFEYRDIFITDKRIRAGQAFLDEHAASLDEVAQQTGVPAEIIAAIVGVETFYGRITGNFRVVDALVTQGFDYPSRAKFGRSQLEQFFLLVKEEGFEAGALTGSYAGAMGPPQFIPSSYRAYAVDGDGDGQRDLLGNWDDIIASVANYFVAHRWKAGEPVAFPAQVPDADEAPVTKRLKLSETVGSLQQRGISTDAELIDDTPAMLLRFEVADGDEYWLALHNFYVITRYNRSQMYALAVYQLASELAAAQAAPKVARSAP
ncbi:MAG: lytic murein transglycosylase B [Chromatiales bacterium]|nr:MAG: lytic murein transglycosylase B [Chromatiales bacterium]